MPLVYLLCRRPCTAIVQHVVFVLRLGQTFFGVTQFASQRFNLNNTCPFSRGCTIFGHPIFLWPSVHLPDNPPQQLHLARTKYMWYKMSCRHKCCVTTSTTSVLRWCWAMGVEQSCLRMDVGLVMYVGTSVCPFVGTLSPCLHMPVLPEDTPAHNSGAEFTSTAHNPQPPCAYSFR